MNGNFLFRTLKSGFLALIILFSFLGCYKSPKSGGLFDFLPMQTSVQALNNPGLIEVHVVGLSAATVSTPLLVDNSFGDPTLSFSADGIQSFSVSHKPGLAVSLTLTTLPTTTPPVSCSIFSPPTVTSSPKTVFTIQCAVAKHTVNVQVFGVYSGAPAGLVLGNKVGASVENLAINTGDGTYAFPTQVGETIAYSVSVSGTPTNHECYMRQTTSPPPSSTMGTVDITLIVNCLSVISFPPNVVSSNGTLQFTFSTPNVTGCAFSAGPVPTGYTSLDTVAAAPTYTNTANSTIVRVDPATVWSAGVQTKGWLSLKNCSSSGNIAYEANKNAEVFLTVLQNIRYVDVNTTAGIQDCQLDTTPCKTIQAAVTSCNATGQVCYVLIADGTYILSDVTSNIILNAKTSLSGNYSPDFQFQGTGTGTTIIDTRATCNIPGNITYSASLCPAIEVKPTVGAGEIFEINNMTVIALPNKQKVTPIFIYDYVGSGKIQIYKTALFGNNNIGVSNTADERYGIIVTNSNNVQVFGNIIVGGAGAGVSAGVMLDHVLAYTAVFSNLIDGGASSGLLPANYSAGIEVRNQNTGNYLAIINNQVNYYQYVNPGAAANRRSVGFRVSALNSTLTWMYLIQNTIYAGNGTTSAKAIEVLLPSATLQFFNNLLFGKDTIGPNTAMETVMPASFSVIGGNSYYGTTLVFITAIGAANYCPTDFQFSMDTPATCSPAGNPPAGFFGGMQYSKQVQFQAGPSNYTNAFALVPETVSTDPPCDVRSGGVGFGIDSNFTAIQDSDFFFRPRTPTLFGRSVGAIELDVTNCSP